MTTGTATTGSAGDSINYNPDNFTQWPEGPYTAPTTQIPVAVITLAQAAPQDNKSKAIYDVYNGKTAWTTKRE